MEDEEERQAKYYLLMKASRRVLVTLVMKSRSLDPMPRLAGTGSVSPPGIKFHNFPPFWESADTSPRHFPAHGHPPVLPLFAPILQKRDP
jgi:hypothetical protein